MSLLKRAKKKTTRQERRDGNKVWHRDEANWSIPTPSADALMLIIRKKHLISLLLKGLSFHALQHKLKGLYLLGFLSRIDGKTFYGNFPPHLMLLRVKQKLILTKGSKIFPQFYNPTSKIFSLRVNDGAFIPLKTLSSTSSYRIHF